MDDLQHLANGEILLTRRTVTPRAVNASAIAAATAVLRRQVSEWATAHGFFVIDTQVQHDRDTGVLEVTYRCAPSYQGVWAEIRAAREEDEIDRDEHLVEDDGEP